MSWLEGSRARLRLLFGRRDAESRMDREFRFHLEMETERLMREEGLDAGEARRRALVAFGGVDNHKEALRDGRGLAWLGGFSLDMKLGFRMLRKYPGLTLVGGLAMAFAIWTGAVVFQVMGLFVHPSLPLPDGDRIVVLGNWDLEQQDVDPRVSHEFIAWRGSLRSVTDLGAYRDVFRNLIVGDDARGVKAAEVTATAFRIAPIAPLLGRAIIAADEQPGAPPVVVLGYEVWQTRFASDPAVIGRSVQLGDDRANVIGVMPKGFAFPVAHELWTQLRPDLLDRTPRGGPGITIFGRLAPGVSLEEAQSELTAIGRRTAAELPATHARLEPRVAPYAKGIQASPNLAIFGSIYFFALLLLVLVCSNVALLIFARAATRETELVVRSALGADRKRIVMQLFAEALVLGVMAAVLGLAMADYALRTWAAEFVKANLTELPFWYHLGLSPATVAYALGLTVIAAVIAGAMPALRITRGLGAQLKQGTAGSGVRFGGVWTAVIIAQVAVTVAFPAIVFVEQRELRRIQTYDVGFAAHEYLGMQVNIDAASGENAGSEEAQAAHRARYAASVEELRRRVESEPGVAGVTFVDRMPRKFHREGFVEVDGVGEVPGREKLMRAVKDRHFHEVSFASIEPSYFGVLKSPIVMGRAFDGGDHSPEARVAIVDQAFVEELLQGRNPIGRRLRFVQYPLRDDGSEEPWLEIVGVVKELGMTFMVHQHRAAGVYLPADLAYGPFQMMVHVPGDPLALSTRVREITAAVDPMLRLSGMQRVDQVTDGIVWILEMWLRVSVLLAAIAVLLSLAGIYAVLSFIVSRRTREIGVRVALGASPRRLLLAIFRRPLTHVALGVGAGATLIGVMAFVVAGGDGGLARVEGGFSPANVGMLLGYAGIMLSVCLIACVVPTRRALKVQPTEAMRAE